MNWPLFATGNTLRLGTAEVRRRVNTGPGAHDALPAHDAPIRKIGICPNARNAAVSLCEDGTLRLWELNRAPQVPPEHCNFRFRQASAVAVVVLSPNQTHIAVLTGTSVAFLKPDGDTLTLDQEVSLLPAEPVGTICAIRFHADPEEPLLVCTDEDGNEHFLGYNVERGWKPLTEKAAQRVYGAPTEDVT